MTSIDELRSFFDGLDYKLIIAADGETRSHRRQDGTIVEQTPAGGVSVAFDVLCQAAGATYIARAKSDEDREVVDADNEVQIQGPVGSYTLKRIFLTPEEEEAYYAGFSNQTLWPLCHVAFERPVFDESWFKGYQEVNRTFAENIEQEITGKTFVWVNDYQLSSVPGMLERREDTIVGLFWHIPWPTWEIFRILPHKREILESLLSCDYIAFHRRYQARNFLNAVDRELAARIDFETNTVYYKDHSVRVANLPMGIDVDVIRNLLTPNGSRFSLLDTIRSSLGFGSNGNDEESSTPEQDMVTRLSERYRIMLGVDRLDYTKGIPERLKGIDCLFEKYPEYRGKVVYIGIMSPTRDAVPAYQALRDDVEALANCINEKYATAGWKPLHMIYNGFTREDVVDLYRKASVCLVTPLDDGMNLVSKEFVVAASCSDDPGMLVLSQWAGSAIDLRASLLVNPYDTIALAEAIHNALEMPREERITRTDVMVELLEERNVYEWAMSFVRNAVDAVREQQHGIILVR